MRYDAPKCCPAPAHPPRTVIQLGSAALARQTVTFPGWRAAMLRAVGDHKALKGWTADRDGDLGVMLLEMWAYVLDVTSFYDARLAERAYLGTAHEETTVGEIVSLLGYEPRPAMAAAVQLALGARGVEPVRVAERTAFRSEAFDAEPPQIFELLGATTIWPQRNSWTLAPYRRDLFEGTVRFRPAEGPARGSVVAIRLGDEALFAGEVATVDTESLPDGDRYQRVSFVAGTDTSRLATDLTPSRLQASVLGLRAPLSGLADSAGAVVGTPVGAPDELVDSLDLVSGSKDGLGWVILDAFYPQIAAGSVAALEDAGTLRPVLVTHALRFDHQLTVGSDDASFTQTVPASLVVFGHPGPLQGRDLFLHTLPRPLGPLVRPAESERTLADLALQPDLLAPAARLGDAPAQGSVIAVGLAKRGALVEGLVSVSDDGTGRFVPTDGAAAFPAPLLTPVSLLGNLATAVRGESVVNEVLGSGEAAAAFQAFALKNKPLTWVTDSSTTRGRRPQVDVAVDGRYWTWVETLYGAGPEDRVFVVRMSPDGTGNIAFGDGVTGSRLPSGVANVIASYRFGAGAAKPPAGSVNQIARPVKDLERVWSPLPAYGGADAEDADDIRQTAPAAMLSLGRAVSAADYRALSRAFTGVVNAAVAQRWDPARLCVTIDVSIIADSGDPSDDLVHYLEQRSAPGVPVTVSLATAIDVPRFDVAVTVAAGYVAKTVRDRVTAALFDPLEGLLAPPRLTIGAPVFHSSVVAAVHAVEGVAGVDGISLASGPMDVAMVPGPGAYFAYLTKGEVV